MDCKVPKMSSQLLRFEISETQNKKKESYIVKDVEDLVDSNLELMDFF